MRFPSPVAIVVFVLMAGLVGPVEGKGGKGGRGHAHANRGGAASKTHGAGQGGSKHEHAQNKPSGKDKDFGDRPEKEKVAKDWDAKEKKEKVAKDKTAKEKAGRDGGAEVDEPADDSDGSDEGITHNKKEKQLANFQRQRDKKLAQAEHLREIAERTGNTNLAANADRMEAQAYEQYARKVSHLEKFGVTDPLLDRDGDGFADPHWPHVDPLDDPLGDELVGELADSLLDDPLGTVQSVLRLRR